MAKMPPNAAAATPRVATTIPKIRTSIVSLQTGGPPAPLRPAWPPKLMIAAR